MELRIAWRGLASVLLVVATFVSARTAAADDFASECAPPDGPVTVVVGQIACQRIDSAAVGGVTAFGYYVPPACVGRRCPVLYVMQGTGGSYRSYLHVGGDASNQLVQALTKGPPVDTETVADPWNYGDTSAWIPKPEMDMVLVTPHNKTVPGGYGPTVDTDGFWSDWNPRYAAGGEQPAYNTPAPRFDTMVVDEVMPWVEAHLPVGNDRAHRAIIGKSQGGLGALLVGLHHPDLFASITALSGASIPLGYMPAASTMRGVTPGIGAPVALPYTRLPAVVPSVYPVQNPNVDDPTGFIFRIVVNGLRAPALGYGDPVADEAYWRGNMTQDLAANARAWSGDAQSVAIELSLGDMIPYRAEVDPTSVFLEAFANYITDMQKVAFTSEAVTYREDFIKGTHSYDYEAPHYRFWFENLYARLRHADGSGSPAPDPGRFDYRSIFNDFDIWGWHMHVDRQPTEFLTLRDTSCSSVTLQGSGTATVTVPASCGTGLDGSRTFTVDLGPSMPTDEHAMASYTGLYNHVTTVDLEPL